MSSTLLLHDQMVGNVGNYVEPRLSAICLQNLMIEPCAAWGATVQQLGRGRLVKSCSPSYASKLTFICLITSSSHYGRYTHGPDPPTPAGGEGATFDNQQRLQILSSSIFHLSMYYLKKTISTPLQAVYYGTQKAGVL